MRSFVKLPFVKFKRVNIHKWLNYEFLAKENFRGDIIKKTFLDYYNSLEKFAFKAYILDSIFCGFKPRWLL